MYGDNAAVEVHLLMQLLKCGIGHFLNECIQLRHLRIVERWWIVTAR